MESWSATVSPFSSVPSRSSSPVEAANIELGGICWESPTTTTALERPMAPMASATRIWEASSKTTTSKSTDPTGRYLETECGLMSRQGVRSSRTGPVFSMISRMDPPRF